jgi:hypothetical protein
MRLTLTSLEFCDIIGCMLYDQVTNPEEMVPIKLDGEWADFIEVLTRKGLKAVLLQRYLSTDPQIRVRYNMIKKVFRNKPDSNVYIEIRSQQAPENSTINKSGKFLKKVLSLGLLK